MSLTRLPIAAYPDITPPTIAVSASCPGATETVAKTGAP
ncbi:MAG: efflux RND transporter permease subunit [Bilophila wadsworthia]